MAQIASLPLEKVCPFFKGDRVEFTSSKDGKTHIGTVKNILDKDRISVDRDDGMNIKWGWKNFRPSTVPAPVCVRKVCPFHIGERVECTDPRNGKVVVGIVKNILEKERISVTLDNGGTFKWLWEKFSKSNSSAPRVVNPFAVGDRIETEHKGKTIYGFVKSIRDLRITMVVDNASYTLSGSFGEFHPSKRSAPGPAKEERGKLTFVQVDVPNAMDDYAVTKFKATPVRKGVWEGHEGNGYHAIITHNGKSVLEAFNEGVGGCGRISALAGSGGVKDARIAESGFMTSLKSSYVQFGGKAEDFTEDLLDVWVEWYVSGKNSGVLWESEVKEMHAICEKFRK